MVDLGSPPIYVSGFSGSRHWKIWAMAATMAILAATGTWIAGQYRIGRLDNVLDRYSQPIGDFASIAARAKPGSMEADLLESCKQAQIGSWLQTTDALEYVDPTSGNRIVVRLDPARAYIDLNGREMSTCISDEIENRQYDIGSMSNTWALVLFVLGLGLGAWAWFGWDNWRRRARAMTVVTEPGVVMRTLDELQPEPDASAPPPSDDKPA